MSESLKIRKKEECKWDLVSLGEVMLRLDPGDVRVATTRQFQVWEGGGEYNVARGLRRCFGLKTSIVTALADNPVGRLVEDLMLQGGVDQSHLIWRKYDGVGRTTRNGLNFTERGFGVRAALGGGRRDGRLVRVGEHGPAHLRHGRRGGEDGQGGEARRGGGRAGRDLARADRGRDRVRSRATVDGLTGPLRDPSHHA